MSVFLRVGQFVCLLAALALSAGCSSIVEGTTQSVTVKTDPAGATCDLTREGVSVGVVNPTPGTVTVKKSKHHIAVSCALVEHEPAAGVLSSSFEGMTLGNVLIGGFIGLAIDASSGAINKYPASIDLVLPPVSFESAEDRDNFYKSLIVRMRERSNANIRTIITNCGSAESEGCQDKIALAEKALETQLADLEVKRARAKIEN